MSLRSSNIPYDSFDFEELVERVASTQDILTVDNYIDTHMESTIVLALLKV